MFQMTLDTIIETDVMELLPQVEAPTLVLHRREVQYPSLDAARTLASGIPSAQLVVLEGDSLVHYSGDSDSFVSAINEFLGEGEETPAAEPKAEPPTQPPPTAAVRRTGAELMEQELGFCTTSDGVSIAYATVGEGPPLVYATGWPGHLSSEWETPHSRALIEDLAQGVTLIRYDMRGSGLSDREPGELSFEYWLTDLEAVVDHLQLESFALLSLGFLAGPICVAYSAAHPERVSHLIMSEGYMRGEELMTPERGKAIVDFISLYGFPVSFEGGDQSIERLQTIQDVSKIQNQAASLEVQGEVARNMLSVDVSSLVDKISMPTLIMHGSSDESIVPFRLGRNLAAAIPQAKFVAFDEPVSEPSRQQERITTEIRRFLGVEVEPKPKPTPPSAAEQGGAVAADKTRVIAGEGRTFASGRYVVVSLLGQGAQKSVYLVDDTVLGRQCALSMLNAALLDPSDVDRIKREAQTMAQLGTQPNIVTVHDYGEEDGAPFIVCEYVPGGELRDELATADGPLPLERALTVAIDICRALSFAHRRDIVHRDLKPENVWLTEERSAKLGDFGIALSIGRTRLTMPGGVTGTATYMAPEQASGGDVDARSDLYAFGVLLYELVTGRPPFVGDDPNAVIYQHINAEPESPVEHNPAVPPGLERLILRLLAKPKTERPASAEEVLAELERAALELAGGSVPAAVGGAGRKIAVGDNNLTEPQVRFCTSGDGTSIAYATLGEGPPLVHLPGWSSNVEWDWERPEGRTYMEGLAEGRTLVWPMRRGVGASQRDVEDVSLEAQLADLAAVIDSLKLERFDLIGREDGGALCIAYAADHPEQVGRLVLWAPFVHGADIVGPDGGRSLVELTRSNWPLARRALADIVFPNGPIEWQKWLSSYFREAVSNDVAAKHMEFTMSLDVRAFASRVRAPTLVLHRRLQRSVPIAAGRAAAALIPDARFVTLEGDAGLIYFDPEQVLKTIIEFLDEGRTQ
ncbi:MAG: alpha/beta fold hydrolase [Chloroflexi bacterium]|nr:alpha/beta fold hydrolase [Chloroflexota bacterium]